MSILSDSIELFIKELMEQSDEISLQRNELAQHFACAPSQINYVLSTRFTLDHGYVIVSRRGGGGYIRLTRVETGRGNPLYDTACGVGEKITRHETHAMVARLLQADVLEEREAKLILAAADACSLPTQELEDGARARIIRGMLISLLQLGERGAS